MWGISDTQMEFKQNLCAKFNNMIKIFIIGIETCWITCIHFQRKMEENGLYHEYETNPQDHIH